MRKNALLVLGCLAACVQPATEIEDCQRQEGEAADRCYASFVRPAMRESPLKGMVVLGRISDPAIADAARLEALSSFPSLRMCAEMNDPILAERCTEAVLRNE